jgi:hypothetical protein
MLEVCDEKAVFSRGAIWEGDINAGNDHPITLTFPKAGKPLPSWERKSFGIFGKSYNLFILNNLLPLNIRFW